MKRFLALPFFLLSCLPLTAALAQSNAADQYQLTIGDQTYEVTEGKPFTVPGPNGEPVQAILRQKQILTYQGYGIKFDYPRNVKVTAEDDQGIIQISLETTGSYMGSILVAPAVVDPSEIRIGTTRAVAAQMRSVGAKLKSGATTVVSRLIHGQKQLGTRQEFTMKGQTIRVETFAFRMGDKTLGLWTGDTTDETKSSEFITGTILKSLTVLPAK